jgi:hypothetical protein
LNEPALIAVVCVAAALTIPSLGRLAGPLGSSSVAAATLAALAVIGSPRFGFEAGFLVEPIRAWGAIGIIALLGTLTILRNDSAPYTGLVAAGSILALLGGHALIVLGGLLVADLAFALRAHGTMPRTLHAANGSRVATLLLFASTALVAAGVLLGSNGAAAEPLVVQPNLFMIFGVGLRAAALLPLKDRESPLTAVVLGLPLLAVLAWIHPEQTGWMQLGIGIVAVIAAHTWSRTGGLVCGATTLTLLVVMLATAEGQPLTLIPLTVALLVSTVALSELVNGGALLVLPLLWIVVDAGVVPLLEAAPNLTRISGVLMIAASGFVAVGAFGVVPRHARNTTNPLIKSPLMVVVVGIVAIASVLPERIVSNFSPEILKARVADPLIATTIQFDSWHMRFVVAAVAGWVLALGIKGLRAPVAVSVNDIDATTVTTDEMWLKGAAATLGLAALLTLIVAIRSMFSGWL